MNIKIIRSERKTMSLSVNDELEAIVRAPLYAGDSDIESFVRKNEQWLVRASEHKSRQLEKYASADFRLGELVDKARAVIPEKVKHYSELMNLLPTGVKITKAKKRFGSCSAKNSLCFSCYLMLYPTEAVDYVIVHELAHIKHRNHGKDFYELIAGYMPDYKIRENMLKDTE